MFVLLKPTDSCNLNCAYCCVGDSRRGSTFKMSVDQAKLAISRVLEHAAKNNWPDLTLCFHGGEPLLAGVEFFYEVLTFAQSRAPKTCNVDFSIQSNLTLFNNSYLSLFKEFSVQVSTSLDGPETIHNKIRPYLGGKGSFSKIIKALDLLRANGVKTGIICTVNRGNWGDENEIFRFFKSISHDFKANHVHDIGAASDNNMGLSAQQIANSMINFFDLWFYDQTPKIRERNTFDIATNLFTGKPSNCVFQRNCQESIICIEPDGFITACDAMKYLFPERADTYYGNIFVQSFNEILNSDNRTKYLQRGPQTLTECTTCKYSKICNGGCMLDAIAQNGRFTEKSPRCLGYKIVFTYIEEALSKIQQPVLTTALAESKI